MNEFAPDQTQVGQGGTQNEPAQPQVTSLDSLPEFEFKGQKLTPDRLQEVLTGFESANHKVKTYESEKTYWDNLRTDLQNVRLDPRLAEKFKATYPDKFHSYLEVLDLPDQTHGMPKEFMNEFGELRNGYAKMLLPKLYEKYPLSSENEILARADSLLSQGAKLNDAQWEKIAKESHEAMKKKSDAFYKKELKTQIEKGEAGKDVPPGGPPPGKAPVKPRTFKEAEEAMIKHMNEQGMKAF